MRPEMRITMAKAYLIDSKNRTITPYVYSGLNSAQAAVGGLIAGAMQFENGDYLFVNDEGLFMFDDFFAIEGGYQPFAGNGLLVGPETEDGESLDVQTSLDKLADQIVFLSRFELQRVIDRQVRDSAQTG